MSGLLITGLAEVATARGTRPLGGDAQGRLERLAGAEVYCHNGRITFVGPASERRRKLGELADAAVHVQRVADENAVRPPLVQQFGDFLRELFAG